MSWFRPVLPLDHLDVYPGVVQDYVRVSVCRLKLRRSCSRIVILNIRVNLQNETKFQSSQSPDLNPTEMLGYDMKSV